MSNNRKKIYFCCFRTSLQQDNFDDDHLLEILRTKDTQVNYDYLHQGVTRGEGGGSA